MGEWIRDPEGHDDHNEHLVDDDFDHDGCADHLDNHVDNDDIVDHYDLLDDDHIEQHLVSAHIEYDVARQLV